MQKFYITLIISLIFIFNNQAQANFKTDSIYFKIWNANAGIYENSMFYKNFVNTNCARIDSSYYYEYSNVQSQWELFYFVVRNYDASNRLTQEMYYSGAVGNNFGRILFNYQNGLLTDSIEQRWNNQTSQYENRDRTILKRRVDSKVDTVIIQDWDQLNNQWINRLKQIIDYASALGIDETTVVSQDWISNNWVNDIITIRSFEAGTATLLDANSFDWDVSASAWKFSNRINYAYDAQKRLLLAVSERYDSGLMKWDSSSRSTSKYTDNLVETESQQYDKNASSWKNTAYTSYVKTCNIPSGIEASAKPSWKVYPNPATTKLSIETAQSGTIQITDAIGVTHYNAHTERNESFVDISALPKGLYIATFTTNKGSGSFRFIKD